MLFDFPSIFCLSAIILPPIIFGWIAFKSMMGRFDA